MPILFKDLVPENTHPLNLAEADTEADARSYRPSRPPLFEVHMRMAEELAKRNTCRRLSVGTVIADPTLQNVVVIGYNGNARGFPNDCDFPTPGACGCIHSEMNALREGSGRAQGQGRVRDSVSLRNVCEANDPGRCESSVLSSSLSEAGWSRGAGAGRCGRGAL